jgi:hypothetical protein
VSWLASELESASAMLERVSVGALVAPCVTRALLPSGEFLSSCLFLAARRKATRRVQPRSLLFQHPHCVIVSFCPVVRCIHGSVSGSCSRVSIGSVKHHSGHQKFHGSRRILHFVHLCGASALFFSDQVDEVFRQHVLRMFRHGGAWNRFRIFVPIYKGSPAMLVVGDTFAVLTCPRCALKCLHLK